MANYILLIQRFEVYDENLNQLMNIIEICVDNKIRRINRIIVENVLSQSRVVRINIKFVNFYSETCEFQFLRYLFLWDKVSIQIRFQSS